MTTDQRWVFKRMTVNQNGCWIWCRQLNPAGYGVAGRGRLAHRLSYEAFVGPIPKGEEIHHVCRQTNCVNPEHLRVVTRNQHVRFHLRTHCIRGHEFDLKNTLWRPNGARGCRACQNIRVAAYRERIGRERMLEMRRRIWHKAQKKKKARLNEETAS